MATRTKKAGVVMPVTVPQVPGATQVVQGELRLSQLFSSKEQSIKDAVLDHGYYDDKKTNRRLYVQTADIPGVTGDKRVVALAAVARDPGLTQTYINTVQDYLPTNPNRTQQLRQYRRIAVTEGLISNAINKIAAILSGGGRYKVRNAKKGKAR